MKHTIFTVPAILVALMNSSAVMADNFLEHSFSASAHSVMAVGHTAIAGAKIVSGVIAVPLVLSGELGKASADVGKTMWEFTSEPIGKPLPISDETYLKAPSPDLAVKQ